MTLQIVMNKIKYFYYLTVMINWQRKYLYTNSACIFNQF